MDEIHKQILATQSIILVALAAIYADEKDDIEVLNQIQYRQKEIAKLITRSDY